MTAEQSTIVSDEPILSVRNLIKRFGGLTAVNDVSVDVYPGEVVGLVGDNGAGKSTLIKCVSGVHHADGGRIYFEGRARRFSRPIEAREAGIETIYQDLALAGNLPVSANIFLGREVKNRYLGGLIRTLNEPKMLEESNGILDSLGIHIPQMQKEIEKLSGGQRQAVAIARAIYWNAKLMIMDEPTNNLGVPEQRKVMQLIETLKGQGVPVIFISHTLPDVFAATDRIVVMHRGRKVAEMPTASTNTTEIVEYMVGAREQNGDPAALAAAQA
ncbi:MAG: ATP-binding cassette domain-containing protein [Chloroflexota bacterium]|jgi:ABC-type sugar transport system ATPase subunit